MNLKAILAGAAVLMVSGPALAQSTAPTAPTTPGVPATDQKPTPPADTPTTTPPNNPDAAQPDMNNTATSPATPGTTPPSTTSGYGAGWDAKRCADARKQGKPADPSNCPATPKPKS
jgi:hypothetical protein